MAHDVLVGHANAAVQLHRLLADKAHGHAQLVFGAAHGSAAFSRRRIEFEAGVIAHGARQFKLHFHVGHPMTQGLESGDGHAKLLAGVHVVHGDGHGFVHHPHGFGAQGGNADVLRVLQCRGAIKRDQMRGRVGKRQLSGTRTVLGDITPCGRAFSAFFNQEERQLAVGHGGHQPRVGLVTRGHHAFVPGQDPSAAR